VSTQSVTVYRGAFALPTFGGVVELPGGFIDGVPNDPSVPAHIPPGNVAEWYEFEDDEPEPDPAVAAFVDSLTDDQRDALRRALG